jgi:acyl-CoA reductase-like NAD-dependent aldehyde dehydrogenase
MDDADLHRAVAGTIAGAYLCSGQSYTAAARILVHERVHDAFVEALDAAVGKEVVLGASWPAHGLVLAAHCPRQRPQGRGRGSDRRAVRPGLAAALGQRQRVVPAPSDE